MGKDFDGGPLRRHCRRHRIEEITWLNPLHPQLPAKLPVMGLVSVDRSDGKEALLIFRGFREAISLSSRQVAFLGNRTRGASILQGGRRSLPNFLQPYCILLGLIEGRKPSRNLSNIQCKKIPGFKAGIPVFYG